MKIEQTELKFERFHSMSSDKDGLYAKLLLSFLQMTRQNKELEEKAEVLEGILNPADVEM